MCQRCAGSKADRTLRNFVFNIETAIETNSFIRGPVKKTIEGQKSRDTLPLIRQLPVFFPASLILINNLDGVFVFSKNLGPTEALFLDSSIMAAFVCYIHFPLLVVLE